MANLQALCNIFKVDLLNGVHSFGAGTTRLTSVFDTYKAALYLATATINAATAAYTTSGEVPATQSYSAGGVAVTWAAAGQSTAASTIAGGSTAYDTLNANIVLTTFTNPTGFDCVLIYNDTRATKSCVSVHTFGTQTITNGQFTLTMPTNDGVTGLIRIT